MLSRRGFIVSGAAVSGGLVIGYGYIALDDGSATEKFAASGRPAHPLNAWLKIASDGTVICGIHRAEMGQGITTTLAMLLAEELDADWNRVSFEFGPVDRDYYNFGIMMKGQPMGDPNASWLAATGTWAMRQGFRALGLSMTIASSSTVDAWDTLRPAGATARQMLLQAAAEQWNTSVDSLTTERGYVIDSANDRRLDYGALAEAASRQTPPSAVELKDPADYTLIGHNPPRLDAPAKVTGKATFGIDLMLPDMLYAAVVHSPIAGTKVATFDAGAAADMPGVHGVYEAGVPGSATAVAAVAEDSWQALQAAKQITVTAAEARSELVDSEQLQDQYRALLDDGERVFFTDTVAENEDTKAANFEELLNNDNDNDNDLRVSADYAVPFLAHVCMEPMNCVALFTGDKLEIWAPTQANSISRDVAAQKAGLSNEQVTLHTTFMGGGFGRRSEMDFVEQAVGVALQIPGRPIKLFWSREQDIRHDIFRPAATCRMTARLDNNGGIKLLDSTLITQSVVASIETRTPTPRGGDATTDDSVVEALNPPIYPVNDLRLGYIPSELHVPAGAWRSVSHSWCTFFMESFIDELAFAAGQDPANFRQKLLQSRPRHLKALNTVLEQVGTSTADGIGYAVAESHTTVVAHAVEISTENGQFDRVTRVVCAVDCGPQVHPDNIIAQMEGSIVDGVSAALYGQVEIREGRAVPGNFDSYRRMRMADCPSIEVHLIDSEQLRPGGVGEPGVPGVAPALTNAIFAATNKRIRQLPILSN